MNNTFRYLELISMLFLLSSMSSRAASSQGLYFLASSVRDVTNSSFARGVLAPAVSLPVSARLFASPAECAGVASPALSPARYQGRIARLEDLREAPGAILYNYNAWNSFTADTVLLSDAAPATPALPPVASIVDMRNGSWSFFPLTDPVLAVVTAPSADQSDFAADLVLAQSGADDPSDGPSAESIFMGNAEMPVRGAPPGAKGPPSAWDAAPVRQNIASLRALALRGPVPRGLSSSTLSASGLVAAASANFTVSHTCAALYDLSLDHLDGAESTVSGVITAVVARGPGNLAFFLQSGPGSFSGIKVQLQPGQAGYLRTNNDAASAGPGFGVGDAVEVSGMLAVDPASPFRVYMENVTMIVAGSAQGTSPPGPIKALPVPSVLFESPGASCSALGLGLDGVLVEVRSAALVADADAGGQAAAVPGNTTTRVYRFASPVPTPTRRRLQAADPAAPTTQTTDVTGVAEFDPTTGSFVIYPTATIPLSELEAVPVAAGGSGSAAPSSASASPFSFPISVPMGNPYRNCSHGSDIKDQPWAMFGLGIGVGAILGLILASVAVCARLVCCRPPLSRRGWASSWMKSEVGAPNDLS